LYLIHEYSISDTSKRSESYTTLREKMNRFIEYNPHFGRKIMKRREGASGYHVEFNDKHVEFKRSSIWSVGSISNSIESDESGDESN